MRPIVTDREACMVCRSVCLPVCLQVTVVSPAKTDEPIEMPFGLWSRVGPIRVGPIKGTVLHEVQIAPCEGGNFRGNDMLGHARACLVTL